VPNTFMDNIDRLTIDTHVYIDRDDGKQLVTRPGLLPQLREAVATGLESTAGSSAFGSRPPIAPAARDLLTEIERQAWEAYRDALAPKAAPVLPVESVVRGWAAVAGGSKMVTVRISHQEPDDLVDRWRREHLWAKAVNYKVEFLPAERVASRWVEQIDGLFNPPSTWEIQGACPSCEATHTLRTSGGVTTRSRAMAFLRDESGKTVEARCAACGAVWYPFQFEWLAKAVGAKPLPELQEKIS